MPDTLSTSAQIIEYIKDLSHFINHVRIVKVYPGGFLFEVNVPLWYKLVFKKRLSENIQKNLSERMITGIGFKFKIISKNFF